MPTAPDAGVAAQRFQRCPGPDTGPRGPPPQKDIEQMPRQCHQTIVKLGASSNRISRDEIENMYGWRNYSKSAAARHGYELYDWLRAHASKGGVQIAVSKFCDGVKLRPDIYTGLAWLGQNGFVVETTQEAVRTLAVQPIPVSPEGTDPRQGNKGVSSYGTVILRVPNAAGDPCEAEAPETELDNRLALFNLSSPTENRRHALYLELRASVGAVHWAHMTHATPKTIHEDLGFLEERGLVVQCLDHGVLVVTSPLDLWWRPDDEALICGEWVDECRAAAKRALLNRSTDLELLLAFYRDLREHKKLSRTVTPHDHHAAAWLLQSRSFDEIRPSFAYFMCNAKDDLEDRGTGRIIERHGHTIQTYKMNLASIEDGYRDIAYAYSFGDESWEHYLKSDILIKWRINPLRPLPAAEVAARAASAARTELRAKEAEERAKSPASLPLDRPSEEVAARPHKPRFR